MSDVWWHHRRRRFVRSRLSGWESRPAFGVLMGVFVVLWLALAVFGDLLAGLRWAPAGSRSPRSR